MPSAFEHSSLLFAAGHRPDRFDKALSRAPFICIDLEDSVPAEGKDTARHGIRDFLAAQNSPDHARITVRISHPDSDHGPLDIAMLAALDPAHRPGAVMIPMVETVSSVEQVASALHLQHGQIIALVETPAGIRNAADIAKAPAVGALMFGGADFAALLGVDMDWEPLLLARLEIVLACAEAGIPAIDVPFLDVGDPDGLYAESRRVKALGFAAKAAIHPEQVGVIADAFRPSADELDQARRIVAAFEASDGAAQLLDGRMIEAPVVARARRQLKQAG